MRVIFLFEAWDARATFVQRAQWETPGIPLGLSAPGFVKGYLLLLPTFAIK